MIEKNNNTTVTFEPRLVRLETGMDIVTKQLSELSIIVRDQSRSFETELQKLMIAVTAASGPKKTNWSVVISIAFLILALGSTAFWPIKMMTDTNKESITNLAQKFSEHEKSLHLGNVDLLNIKQEIELENERVSARLTKLETINRDNEKLDQEELRQWRFKSLTGKTLDSK